MPESRSPYAAYVRLSTLLTSQLPRSPRSDTATWAAERYFIVCHQVSELLASQILTDLKCAAKLVSLSEQRSAVQSFLTRAAACSMQFYQHLEQLMCCCPKDAFLAFRPLLQSASASESNQFGELLTIAAREHPDCIAIQSTLHCNLNSGPVSGAATALAEVEARNILEALCVTSEAIGLWRQLHVVMAAYFIDSMPGTGGTSGVDYLMRRLRADARKHSGSDREIRCPPHASVPLTMRNIRSSASALGDRLRVLEASTEAEIDSTLHEDCKVPGE